MKDYKLTKQAFKKLKKLSTSNIQTAKQIKNAINKLRQDLIVGETLQGFSNFRKIRIGSFRLIYTFQEDIIIIAIIEKRESVYQTFAHLVKKSDFLNI